MLAVETLVLCLIQRDLPHESSKVIETVVRPLEPGVGPVQARTDAVFHLLKARIEILSSLLNARIDTANAVANLARDLYRQISSHSFTVA